MNLMPSRIEAWPSAGGSVAFLLAALLVAGFAAAVLPAPLAAANPPGWTNLGPFGANVLALAVDPTQASVVYAGTTSGGGVFKSTDGSTWVGAFAGLPIPNLSVPCLAIDPRHPSTIY